MGGIETDYMLSAATTGSLSTLRFDQKSLGSIRARTGWVFGNVLGYGTIGWGYGSSTLKDASGSGSSWATGAVFGGGAEFSVTRTFSARLEYLRYDLNRRSFATPTQTKLLSSGSNILRAGITARF